MEGDENDLTPFWLQSSDSRRQRRLSRSSSLLFNSSAFLIVLIVTTLAFIFFIIPTILSFASQIFKPQSVKKSWDSLNLILVLFAIICGFLSRNSGENASPYEDRTISKSSSSREVEKSNPSSPNRWYQYSDRTLSYNNGNGLTRLRNSSSYPDLRQESSWVTRDEQWQFYDDTHVSNYRPLGSDGLHQRRRPLQEPEKVEKDQNLETKNIEVDTFQVRTEVKSHAPEPTPQPSTQLPPQPPPFPPPSPPTAPVKKRKAKRTYQDIRQKDEIERNNFSEVKHVNSQPPPPPLRPPPPPPPLPPPPTYQESEPKSGKSEKKRNTATKDFLISLRRKKKKQRQKSVENFESILTSIDHTSSLQSSSSYPSPSPPPPPPPPPPSVFHNLFSSKKGKNRNPYSRSQPPPPPPRPPVTTSTLRVSKNKALSKPIPVTHKLPLSATTGSESPAMSSSIPPPPPPPPPFKIQDWKFVKHGDFVRIKSSGSSRSVSPDLDESEDSSIEGTSPLAASEGGQSPAPSLFCPSPDVDTKADNFIARFRAGLILEKENSFRQRDRAKSRFGPQSGLGRKNVEG
ncbi:hypothetical protein G4B88_019887 [Cannabis sativa]|uniref:Hydroxyproline-rich glycoprotein family protein n=1 Tax=Cannabis sativa TaxID=3483 RepID=A0A7J6HSB6_CANSA|nr:hypothetical protein G4B88_019887 [Cannabis sativa]